MQVLRMDFVKQTKIEKFTEVPCYESLIPNVLPDSTSVDSIGGKVIVLRSPDSDTPMLDFKAKLSAVEN